MPAASWEVEKSVAQVVVPRVGASEGEKDSEYDFGRGIMSGAFADGVEDGGCGAKEMHMLKKSVVERGTTSKCGFRIYLEQCHVVQAL
jgi:hypothetical protein